MTNHDEQATKPPEKKMSDCTVASFRAMDDHFGEWDEATTSSWTQITQQSQHHLRGEQDISEENGQDFCHSADLDTGLVGRNRSSAVVEPMSLLQIEITTANSGCRDNTASFDYGLGEDCCLDDDSSSAWPVQDNNENQASDSAEDSDPLSQEEDSSTKSSGDSPTNSDQQEEEDSTSHDSSSSSPRRSRGNRVSPNSFHFSESLRGLYYSYKNITPPTSLRTIQSQESEEFQPPSVIVTSEAGSRKERKAKKSRRRRSSSILLDSAPTRFFSFIFFLWVLELVLVVMLKRAGVVEPEFRFDQAVAKRASRVWNDTVPLALLMQQSLKLLAGNETSLYSLPLAYLTQEKKRPGYQLAQQGAKAKYPLVIVPGFVTSGLEVWGGKECARKHFRQRLWAAMVGARSFLTDRDCWRQHMMLDPLTGGDPEDIRLRAASGFEAVDYFMANYWVFGKIIENLADVGYTPSEMAVEPYDWRLAFPMLEKRDGYFTKLKTRIEAMHHAKDGEKVVITSHSMGALVVHYFFSWVTSPKSKGGGGGGTDWVDKHIHAFVNIAGSHLGVPKAVTSLLSGEMSDTVLVNNPMAMAVEQFFGRKLRQELWSTWGSIWAMLPKGGDALWSVGMDMCNASTDGVDDPFCPSGAAGLAQLLSITDADESVREITSPESLVSTNQTSVGENLRQLLTGKEFSMKTLLDFVKESGGGFGPNLANANVYSLYPREIPVLNNNLPLMGRGPPPGEPAWHDPTQTPLPHAPNMRMYCFYGVGKPTERAYFYKLNRPEHHQDDRKANQTHAEQSKAVLLDPPLILDSDVSNPSQNVEWGIKYTDGDGSVPLLSLGYLCADAYTRPSSGLNPSSMPVYTREYRHRPAEFFDTVMDDPMRSGPHSGDHVDVLGNVDMTHDLLRILTDFDVESQVNHNQITSNIEQMARDINSAPNGGIFKKKRRH